MFNDRISTLHCRLIAADQVDDVLIFSFQTRRSASLDIPNGSSICINGPSSHSSASTDSESNEQASSKKLHLTSNKCCSTLRTLFPILTWLSGYDVKADLAADVVSGVTLAAMLIPQGIGYGKLAGVDAINGLYVSIFPVIVYAIFGGSRHTSMGIYAVICIECNNIIKSVQGKEYARKPKPIDVLISLSFLVGLMQLASGFLRLGIVAKLLSSPINSAFVVASSVHVCLSQTFLLFGTNSRECSNHRTIETNITVFDLKLVNVSRFKLMNCDD
jgi:hypothetical protein